MKKISPGKYWSVALYISWVRALIVWWPMISTAPAAMNTYIYDKSKRYKRTCFTDIASNQIWLAIPKRMRPIIKVKYLTNVNIDV